MIPETSESKSLRIYESNNFPFEWKIKRIFMEGISGADPTIFSNEWQVVVFS